MRLKLVMGIMLIALLTPLPGFAWNMMLHQIIAQIAYDSLTPAARTAVNRTYPLLGQFYPPINSFAGMASWPDYIKGDSVSAFNTWHYINQPLSFEKMRKLPKAKTQNVLWAIGQAQKVLASSNANTFEHSMFLAFLMHFIGDVHQPLHVVTFYSAHFPHGDNGGNLFKVHSPVATNLHSLWDNGLGLFPATEMPIATQVQYWAKKIEQTYPPSFFGGQIQDNSPANWANESYRLAKQDVYTITPGATPSKVYIEKGQTIVMQRVALAGYRLAFILNSLYK